MIQYKVKPITRYIVTRFETTKRTGPSVTERGQFDSYNVAYEVAYAMCKLEHEQAGTSPADMNFQYPTREDARPESYVRNCQIEPRVGDDKPLFEGVDGGVLARLEGYRITPL